MTQEELISHFCDYRGKCTSDDVVALTFAYRMLAPRWISVEDELPEQNRWVLTYNGSSINLLMFAGNGGWYDHSVAKHRNVTHWMPLPAPPEIPNNCEKGGEK